MLSAVAKPKKEDAIDWKTVKIPREQYEDIDKFVKSELGRRNGITSVNNFVVRLVAKFFEKYNADYKVLDTDNDSK